MKYRKKPIIIEAIQYTGDNLKEIKAFASEKAEDYIFNNKSFYINTLEGDMKASVGDFIIKGIRGEFYPCKPEIFKETYDKLKEHTMNKTQTREFLTFVLEYKKTHPSFTSADTLFPTELKPASEWVSIEEQLICNHITRADRKR